MLVLIFCVVLIASVDYTVVLITVVLIVHNVLIAGADCLCSADFFVVLIV